MGSGRATTRFDAGRWGRTKRGDGVVKKDTDARVVAVVAVVDVSANRGDKKVKAVLRRRIPR